MSHDSNINVLVGLTLKRVEQKGSDRMDFETTDGRSFLFYHSQECCEFVNINSIQGDLNDLLDSPILWATEDIQQNPSFISTLLDWASDRYIDSATLTTFAFTTAKGQVIVRWLGESNGYYSESVSFVETTNDQSRW